MGLALGRCNVTRTCCSAPGQPGEEAGPLAFFMESLPALGADHQAGSWKFAFQVDCISISEKCPFL